MDSLKELISKAPKFVTIGIPMTYLISAFVGRTSALSGADIDTAFQIALGTLFGLNLVLFSNNIDNFLYSKYLKFTQDSEKIESVEQEVNSQIEI